MSKVKLCSLCLGILLVLPCLALAAAGTKPTISALSPTSATAGGATFVLTVSGSGFARGAVVIWNGSALNTTYVHSSQLTATVPNTLIAAAGSATIAVYIAGRTGGTSGSVAFTISAATTTTTTTTTSPLAIASTSVPAGTTGTAYSATLTATGGTSPYTWSVSSGTLPTGLTLSSAGAISGTPTTSGSASFTAQVKDSASNVQTYTYSASIAAGTTTALSISTASLPGGTATTAYPSMSLAATGGTSPYTWSVASGSTLPAGLTLSTAGALSGTPTTANAYSFSLQVADSASHTATQSYSLTVAAAASTGSGTLSAYCDSTGTYGPCGNPYETNTTWPPSTAKSVTACGTLSPTSGQYLLVTQNLGSSLSSTCLTIAWTGPFILDLGGHTITGQINIQSNTMGGTIIFNGIVNCSIPDGSTYGCLLAVNDIPLTSQVRLHHLVVNNAADPGTGAVRAVHVETDGNPPVGSGYKVDHVAITVQSAPSSVRSIGINATTGDQLELSFNNLTCSANASACNGIQDINGYSLSNVPSLIHDNLITLNAAPGISQSARGIAINGPDSGSSAPSGFQVYNNVCTANTNRCFRARQVAGATFQNNTVYNCADTDAGCYHLGDPSGTAPFVTNMNIVVQNESIQMNGGVAFYVRNASAIAIMNNTLTGTTGAVGLVEYLASLSSPTAAEFCNITGASSLSTASGAGPSTTVNINGAGTWGPDVTGTTGTINTITTCP